MEGSPLSALSVSLRSMAVSEVGSPGVPILMIPGWSRTLELVEAKVKEGAQYNISTFSLDKLISPANLELIRNLSGCEAARRFAEV